MTAAAARDASEIERVVISQVAAFLGRTGELVDELGAGELGPDVLKCMMAAAEHLATVVGKREVLVELVAGLTIGETSVAIELKREALAVRLIGEVSQGLVSRF